MWGIFSTLSTVVLHNIYEKIIYYMCKMHESGFLSGRKEDLVAGVEDPHREILL